MVRAALHFGRGATSLLLFVFCLPFAAWAFVRAVAYVGAKLGDEAAEAIGNWIAKD